MCGALPAQFFSLPRDSSDMTLCKPASSPLMPYANWYKIARSETNDARHAFKKRPSHVVILLQLGPFPGPSSAWVFFVVMYVLA